MLRVAVLAGTMLSLLAAGWFAYCETHLHRWRSELATSSGPALRPHLESVLWLGGPGQAALIDALDSPRGEVSLVARDVVQGQLASAARRPADLGTVRHWARLLEKHSAHFARPGRGRAAQLALEILRLDGPASNDVELVTCCESILRRGAKTPTSDSLELRQRSLAMAGRVLNRQPAEPRPAVPLEQPDVFPALTGQPIEPEHPEPQGQPRQPSLPEPTRLGSLPGQGQGAPPVRLVAPQGTEGQAAPSVAANTESPPTQIVPRLLPAPEQKPAVSATGPRQLSYDAAADNAATAEDPAPLNDDELFTQLNDDDSELAAAAGRTLAARGYSAEALAVGQGLADESPAVRRKTVDALPASRVDAKPWLLKASRDGDASVRRTALAIMATTGERELMARVAEMARQDHDPEIRKMAGRAMGHR